MRDRSPRGSLLLMVARGPTLFTETEYLALEAVSDRKHERIDGAIVAMDGAQPPHNAIAANVTAGLVQLTRGRGCVTLTSDQRIHVPATGLYTYADVLVTCGERRYKNDNPPSLLDPTIIVEVTSDTSEDFDRGKKCLHYQSIPELGDYIIVSHSDRRIDHYRRASDGQWTLSSHTSEDARVPLPMLDGSIALSDVYADVDFDEGKSASTPR